jgi:diacylglycerol kinase family enzyme
VYVSQYPRDAVGVIRLYLNALPRDTVVRVYAIGGDGILFDCLNGVAEFPAAELAIVPYGITNDFVRAFGEHKNVFRNIQAQFTAKTISTDIMNCGGNYAINFCTVGMESDAITRATRINHFLENSGGLFRRISYSLYNQMYYLGGFLAAFNEKVSQQWYEISIDGESFSGRFRSINIANGPCYGGNKSAVITAVPDDGVLDVLIGKSSSFVRTLSLIPPYLKGRFYKYPADFILKRGKKISIRSDRPLLIHLDDEVFYDDDFTVELIPSGVKIAAVNGLGYERRVVPGER